MKWSTVHLDKHRLWTFSFLNFLQSHEMMPAHPTETVKCQLSLSFEKSRSDATSHLGGGFTRDVGSGVL